MDENKRKLKRLIGDIVCMLLGLGTGLMIWYAGTLDDDGGPGTETIVEDANVEDESGEVGEETEVSEEAEEVSGDVEDVDGETGAGTKGSLKDYFVDFRQGDQRLGKDDSLKALKREAHYFDFAGLGHNYLGTKVAMLVTETDYPKPILFNGRSATLYDDEVINVLRLSDEDDIYDADDCRTFTELITIIQGDRIRSYIMVRRGDAFYTYLGEPKQWELDDIVMSGISGSLLNEDAKTPATQVAMMVERGVFKTFLKLAKKNVFNEDCPFETLGVEYEIDEKDPFGFSN